MVVRMLGESLVGIDPAAVVCLRLKRTSAARRMQPQ